MKTEMIMNPNFKDMACGFSVLSDLEITEISSELAAYAGDYVGVYREGLGQIGAIRTERLKYLIEKNKSSSLYHILDILNVGIVAIDAESRIFYINHAYSDILGIAAGKIVGRLMSEIEPEAQLLKVLANKKVMRIERQLIKSVGKYVSVNMVPLYDQGTCIGACSLFTDVTQIRDLDIAIANITQKAEEYEQRLELRNYLKENHIIGESETFRNCLQKALMVSKTDASVLIRGENGTGKEVICQVIQSGGLRKDAPFVKVNCAAIPESLMESELFGYEEGAFTGARKGGRAGRFELADTGTIFLDEIGDISMAMQAKLLRVLQEGEVERIGGRQPVHIDVRVIAATNRPLEAMIEEGKFRMDLYYRLNVVTIDVPALRDRGNDVLLLSNAFLENYNKKYSMNRRLSAEAYHVLQNFTWPGNVRQLQHVIESAVILSGNDLIGPEDMRIHNYSVKKEPDAATLIDKAVLESAEDQQGLQYENDLSDGLNAVLAGYEKQVILQALRKTGGNREQAYQLLKISRRTFFRKLAEYHIK